MELKKLEFLPVAIASLTPQHSVDNKPIVGIAYKQKIISDDTYKSLMAEENLLIKDALLRWGIEFPNPTKDCVIKGVNGFNVTIDKINGKDIGQCSCEEILESLIENGYKGLLNKIFVQFIEEFNQKKLSQASNN